MVALRNEATDWLVKGGQTCLIAEPTASSLADQFFKAVTCWDALAPMHANAARLVGRVAGKGWSAELAAVVDYVTRPDESFEEVALQELVDERDARAFKV